MCILKECVKFIVFGFNLILLLAGGVLIAVSAIYVSNVKDVSDAIPDEFAAVYYVPILTIVIGTHIFLISFFGCCGAIRDSSCLLTTYAIILLVIFILQIALGVYSVYTFLTIKNDENFKKSVDQEVDKIFRDDKNSSRTVVNFMQSQFECCGTTGPTLWREIGTDIPKSCYQNEDNTEKLYDTGCQTRFFQFLKEAARIIGIVVLALAATEVVGVVFLLRLANSIRNNQRRGGYSKTSTYATPIYATPIYASPIYAIPIYAKSKLCTDKSCLKLLVFAIMCFMFLFQFVGGALIAVGAFYVANVKDVTDAIPDEFAGQSYVPILTIVIGSIIFLICFFGCCGAIRGSSCLLTTYAIILLVIFILQIALGVYTFLTIKNDEDFKKSVDQEVDKIFRDDTNSSRAVVNFMQSQFQCCGTTGPTFWAEIGTPIPKSCYQNEDNTEKLYDTGCQTLFFQFLKDAARIIGIVVLALAATEVVGAVFSLCLANSIRNGNRRSDYY